MKNKQRGKYESAAKPRMSSAESKAQKHLFRTLVSSVVSMILCMTMFLSTTMAWFTDTVESAGNQITVGELKVDVRLGGPDGTSLKENTNTPIFAGGENGVVWKPGHHEVRVLTVENKGNLDIKYTLNFRMPVEAKSHAADIAGYLQVFVKEITEDISDNEITNCDTYANNVTMAQIQADNEWKTVGGGGATLADVFNKGVSATGNGELPAASAGQATTRTYAIALYMKDNVASDLQGKTLNLNIILNAYQSNTPDSEIQNPPSYVSTVEELTNAINEGASVINLTAAGTYKMPSVSDSRNFTIKGTKDTVIDLTEGAYLDSAKVSFEGVTIKGSTGKANGNGSDYAALYTPNVTYTNCTFVGPFRIGRDGATFINCTFTGLGNDYVWTYGNDCTFSGCTFESEGKALLIYSDGGDEVSKVKVENCVFNATKSAYASAISNQACAAIEIQNYGNGVNLTASGNSFDNDYFSGEWRIKAYHADKPAVIVNDTEYKSLALDGKTMTITGTNVTVNE